MPTVSRLQLFNKENSPEFPQYVVSPVVQGPEFYQTQLNRGHVRPFCRSAENSSVFTKKPLQRRLLFSKVAGLEFISCNLIKKELHHKDSCEISLPSIF